MSFDQQPPTAGYPQQQAGYGQPPAGYGPPPAGYGQPPAGYAPPPPPADRPRTHRRVFFVIGMVVGLLLIAQAAVLLVDLSMAKTTTTSHSYDAVGVVELVADGDVNVTAGQGGVEVDAVAHSGLRSPRYSVEEHSDRLVITHRCTFWGWGTVKCSGGLDVTLPPGTEVVVRTANGDVAASGLSSDVNLRSSNGRIEATGIDGRLTVRTSNGSVAVRDAGDDVRLNSSNGAIEVSRVTGSVEADTSNGRIDVRDVSGNTRATTSNGRIEVEQVQGDVFAQTSNGRVTVRGTGEPVRLTISTSNGQQTVEGATDPAATRTVEIRSSNGDVAYLAP